MLDRARKVWGRIGNPRTSTEPRGKSGVAYFSFLPRSRLATNVRDRTAAGSVGEGAREGALP